MNRTVVRAESVSIARYIVCAVVILIVSAAANAQGTSGMLPDPISSRDMETYVAWLQLDDDQKQSVEVIHSQYLDSFRELREGDIQELLDEMQELQRGAMMMPDRQTVEDVLERQRRLLSRIASIDNRFFDDLVPVLREKQIIMLERAKLHRERARYQTVVQAMDFGGRRNVDLAEMLREMPLPAEVTARIDPAVEDYERGLTRRHRELFDLTGSMIVAMMDAFEMSGMAGMGEEIDPDDAMDMVAQMEAIMAEASRPAREKQHDIRQWHSRTFRQVVDLLPPADAEQLRDRFYRRMYPEVFRGNWPADRLFDDVLGRRELSDDDRLFIETIADEYRSNVSRQVEQIVREAERNPVSDSGMFSFGDHEATEYDKELDRYREQRDRLNDEAITALAAILGDESMADLLEQSGSDRPLSVRSVAVGVGGGRVETEIIEGDGNIELDAGTIRVQRGSKVDPLAAISLREMLEYVRRTDLTDSQRAVVESLHQSYLEEFTESRKSGPLAEVSSSLGGAAWTVDPDTGEQRRPTPADVDARHSARERAFEEVTRLDRRFFDDVELAVLEPEQLAQWRRMRTIRELRRLTSSGTNGMFAFSMNTMQEHEVELGTLALDLELDAESSKVVLPLLDEYLREAVDLHQRRRDAHRHAAIEQEKFSISMMSAVDGNVQVAFDGDWMSRMQEIGRPINEVNRSLQSMNRRHLQRLTQALSADDAARLRDAYHRQAFPGVYADAQQLDTFFTSALQQDAIEAPLRSELQSLHAAYTRAYGQVIDELLDLYRDAEPASAMGWDPEQFSEQMSRENTIEKVNFDRRELNLKFARRVKELLTEDQIRRCGGLPRGLE